MPAINSVDQQMLAALQGRIDQDPDIQKLLKDNAERIRVTHDKGGSARAFQKNLSSQITNIAKQKGYLPPGKVFINPNDGKLEGKGGWAGMPTAAKIAIIAGAAAGGVGLAGAMGAFGGAASAGAGAGGAASGAASSLPSLGVAAGLPAGLGTPVATGFGAAGAAGAGAASGAGGTISGLMSGGGSVGLPSLPVTTGIPSWLGGPTATAVGAPSAAGVGKVGSVVSKVLGSGQQPGKSGGITGFLKNLISGNGLQTIGDAAGAVSQSQASNRGTALDAMMEADKMKLAAARDRREDEASILKQLRAINYIKAGGRQKTPLISSSGATIPTFDFGPAPITQADKDNATTLEGQLLSRLKNPMELRDYDSEMEAGTAEKGLDWLGPIVSGAGAIMGANKPAYTMPPAGTGDSVTTQMPGIQTRLRKNG